ncbi:CAP domain-containing protein, partial [Kitasatospora nipponensis]|uniref:CAP domain-containing protein n=1 Tax=Kitasatospora nipponensis TaxID=258049 RepID=UPI0031DF9329
LRRAAGRRSVQLTGAAVLTVAVVGGLQLLPARPAAPAPVTSVAVSAAPAVESSAPVTPSPSPSSSPTPAPSPSTEPVPTPSPTPSAASVPLPVPATPSAPPATPSRAPAPKSLEQQLVDLINAQRAKAGCPSLRVDPRLHAAAQGHSDEMAAAGYFDHVDQHGGEPSDRMTAAGYVWSLWGENLDRATSSPATVVKDWSDAAIHQQNMLNCQYTDAGVGTATAPDGLLWTLDLGRAG